MPQGSYATSLFVVIRIDIRTTFMKVQFAKNGSKVMKMMKPRWCGWSCEISKDMRLFGMGRKHAFIEIFYLRST